MRTIALSLLLILWLVACEQTKATKLTTDKTGNTGLGLSQSQDRLVKLSFTDSMGKSFAKNFQCAAPGNGASACVISSLPTSASNFNPFMSAFFELGQSALQVEVNASSDITPELFGALHAAIQKAQTGAALTSQDVSGVFVRQTSAALKIDSAIVFESDFCNLQIAQSLLLSETGSGVSTTPGASYLLQCPKMNSTQLGTSISQVRIEFSCAVDEIGLTP